jgi:ATP-dependent Lhr-like helicase
MLKYPESLYFVIAMGTIAEAYFNKNNWKPYPFQKDAWNAIASGYDGLLHAPTGSGKTYALWMGILEQYYSQLNPSKGLHCLWLSPLRALSKEIQLATTRVSETLQLSYTIGLRTGDTSASVRSKQKAQMPHGLISTPESLHLLLSQKQYPDTFKHIKFNRCCYIFR